MLCAKFGAVGGNGRGLYDKIQHNSVNLCI